MTAAGAAPAADRARGELAALDDRDLEQLREHGLSADEVARQLRILRRPRARKRLLRPCKVHDGIERWSDGDRAAHEARGAAAARAGRVGFFVPASGAATRMFEPLQWAIEKTDWTFGDLERRAVGGDVGAAGFLRFWAARERFPFWPAWRAELEEAGLVATGSTESDAELARSAIRRLLQVPGLGYGRRPKGLIPFHGFVDAGHRAASPGRSALAEQIHEAFALARDESGRVRFHATVPADFAEEFRRHAAEIGAALDGRLDFTTSSQSPSTDTVALAEDGRPARDASGRLILRPGGHGSLLTNLGDAGGDLLLVRNIDNVQSSAHRDLSRAWRHALLGRLLELEARTFAALEALSTPAASDDDLEVARGLAEGDFGLDLELPRDREGRRTALLRALDRPMRVCGMVPNSGEPGGGPFWIEEVDGRASRQIVESAEVAPARSDQADQRHAWQSATHFNPVDLAISLRDRQGRAFDLERFRDAEAALVTDKTHGAAKLTALEHPGLWNGAMARWLTVFVEVPGDTFSPVKTVLDLLRPEHQAEGETRQRLRS
jgi:hypothetical protein